MPKTDVKIPTPAGYYGGNIYGLIAPAFNALERAGHKKLAKEMQEKIDAEAQSPEDVKKIVKEYVTLT